MNTIKNISLLSVFLVLSVLLSLCNGATLHPKSLKTQSGTASTSSVSSLKSQDQSGSQDSWSKYVEFYGSAQAYKGIFKFDVSSVDADKVTSFKLDVNFRGPQSSDQEWTFEYFVPADNTWISGGDNQDAVAWSWTALSFSGPAPFSTLVSDGALQIRFSSATVQDDCDLDFLAIVIVEDGTVSVPNTPSNPTPAPTNKATSAPTSRPVAAATTRPTPPSTPAPTAAPNSATSAPTAKPNPATSAPTTKPTSAPTFAPTTKPTTAPSIQSTNPTAAPASNGGRICPAGQVWAPAPGTTWQWQLTGTIDQSLDVQMYDIDLFDATTTVISQLHDKDRAVICYFSTQYEDWRPDASKFASNILGNNLDDWPGERYVDIRSAALRKIMTDRLDLAVSKGCDGVEPDNVDGYANSNGLSITAADQLDFNKFLASEAHKRGLSVGLKNDLDQVKSLYSYFDWALNEQCNQYSECNDLNSFVTAGKAVFGVEYSGKAENVCPTMVTDKFSWLMKKLVLDASGTPCCTYAPGGCTTKPAYKCVTY